MSRLSAAHIRWRRPCISPGCCVEEAYARANASGNRVCEREMKDIPGGGERIRCSLKRRVASTPHRQNRREAAKDQALGIEGRRTRGVHARIVMHLVFGGFE